MIHGLRRFAAFGGAAAVVAAAACVPLATASASAVTPKSQQVHQLSKSQILAAVRYILRDVKVGSPIKGVHQVTTGGITASAVSSTNWSGYADLSTSGSTYTSVRGQWKEPKITCSASVSGESLAAFWVGIDGFSSQTVEQDGTIGICEGGTLLGSADWWELYPTNDVQVVNTVSPGDTIISSVVDKNGTYTLKVTDKTNTSASFSETETCATTTCVDSSAEWIGEAPCCSGSSVYPLAKFSEWRVINAHAKSGTVYGSISKFSNDSITMTNGATPAKTLAKPTALSSGGTSFGDKWYAST
jgi:hypothetical protein